MTDFTLPRLLHTAQQQLSDAGIEHADHEALALFAAAAETEIPQVRQWMILGTMPHSAGSPTPEQMKSRFAHFVERRVKHEPLQYIVGSLGFRFLDIAVGPGVFIPRPETETVVQYGIDWLKAHRIDIPNPLVVDLCAGTGVVGLSIATEISGSTVYAVEKDPDAFAWLQKNADLQKLHHPSLAITPVLADATDAQTLKDLNGTVDCILSNPPYILESEPTTQPEVDFDPELALYGGSEDGMRMPRNIISRAAELLRQGGLLVVEHDISQGEAMTKALRDAGFTNAATHDDLTGRPRYTSGVRSDT